MEQSRIRLDDYRVGLETAAHQEASSAPKRGPYESRRTAPAFCRADALRNLQ
jgi:hypothetical protein